MLTREFPIAAHAVPVWLEAVGSKELEHPKSCLPLSIDLLKYYVFDLGYEQNIVPEAFFIVT